MYAIYFVYIYLYIKYALAGITIIPLWQLMGTGALAHTNVWLDVASIQDIKECSKYY